VDSTPKFNPGAHVASCNVPGKKCRLSCFKFECFSRAMIELIHDSFSLIVSYVLKTLPLEKYCLIKPYIQLISTIDNKRKILYKKMTNYITAGANLFAPANNGSKGINQ